MEYLASVIEVIREICMWVWLFLSRGEPDSMVAIFGLFGAAAEVTAASINANAVRDNNAANIAMQRETNQMGLAESQRNRDFQEQMSSSAYQRAMADAEKAGLNPMLAFSQGGASSPSGSQASLTAPKGEAVREGDKFAAAAKAMAFEQQEKQIELTEKQTELASAQELNVINEGRKKAWDAVGAEAEAYVKRANLPAAEAEARYRRDRAELDRKTLKYDKALDMGGKGVGIIKDVGAIGTGLNRMVPFSKTPTSGASVERLQKENSILQKQKQHYMDQLRRKK